MPTISVRTDIAQAYDEQYTPELVEWRDLGAKYKAQHILALCGDLNPKRVLEVGAGEGSILKYLSEAGFGDELHALEISRSGVEFIAARGITSLRSVQLYDGYQIPFADDAVDLVVLSHVLEHVEHPRVLLREIRRVAPHVVIEVPCDFSFDVDRKVDYFMSYGHINVFIPVELRFLLRTEGFEILRDLLNHENTEVLEYLEFVSHGRPRSLINRLRIRYRLARGALRFRLASSAKRQLRANAYTVLCRRSARMPGIFE